MKKKPTKAWGGFVNGKLDNALPLPQFADQDWGTFAIYKTKVEALRHYEDVRRVEIRVVE